MVNFRRVNICREKIDEMNIIVREIKMRNEIQRSCVDHIY